MNFATSLDDLNITLGDTENVTFTPEEKTRALTKAWKDSYVVDNVWVTSETFATGTYQYTIPSGLTAVSSIGISPSNSITSDFPSTIPSDLWTVIGGNIQFQNNANGVIPDGYTLYIRGRYKITVSDTLDTPALQEYVIALAGVNTLNLLGHKKVNLFLKNDTTLAELITLKRELSQDVSRLRASLPREFEPA